MDHDKVVVFIRQVKCENMKKVEELTNNDMFVELSFETVAKKGVLSPAEVFEHRTDHVVGASATQDFPLRGQVHFQTNAKAIKENTLCVKVFDKNKQMGDCIMGTAEVGLAPLINVGMGQDVTIDVRYSKGTRSLPPTFTLTSL
jgi:hypothetical protein